MKEETWESYYNVQVGETVNSITRTYDGLIRTKKVVEAVHMNSVRFTDQSTQQKYMLEKLV